MQLKLVSWNVHGRDDALDNLPDGVDIALLQEVPSSIDPQCIPNGPGPAAIVPISDRASVEVVDLHPVPDAAADRAGQPTSYPGTLSIALVTDPQTQTQLFVVSVYVKWEQIGPNWIVPDGSAHRIVSDISSLITTERHRTPIVVAGDWNIFLGHGETPYWKARYDSVFERMRSLGFELVGPFSPEGGLHRDPPDGWRLEPPKNSVATFHTAREDSSTAWRQLDYVFASASIAESVTTRALNQPAEWGPSDHCRILIDISV